MNKTAEDLVFEAGVYAGKLIREGMDIKEAKHRAACKVVAENFGIRLADCPDDIWAEYIQKLKTESKKKNTNKILITDEAEIPTPESSFQDNKGLQRMALFAIRKNKK